MPRPKKTRCVEIKPCVEALFPKDKGECEYVCLELDELEALRLADYLGFYQEDAAKRMGVSRVTFGRILKSARNKLARAIIEGLGIKVKQE